MVKSSLQIMKYKIVLEKTEEGYSVHCPGLPGCWSQGETEIDAIENIRDAIQEYLAAINEFTMGGIVKDAGLTIDKFRKLL